MGYTELIVRLARLVEGSFFDRRFVPYFKWLERYLVGIGFVLQPEYYARAAITISLLTFILCFTPLVAFHTLILGYGIIPSIILSSLVSFIAGLVAFAVTIYAPLIRYRELGSQINRYMPYILMMLTSLSAGGFGVREVVLRGSAIVPSDAARRSLSRVVVDVMRGEDISDALYREREIVASPVLSSVYEGLAALARTGVGVFDFLYRSMMGTLEELESKLRRAVDSLSVISEIFVIAALMLPLVIEVIILFLGGFIEIGIPPEALVVIVNFIVVPVAFVILVLLVDSILSEIGA
uniref:Type II secretion system protein GspF domain-containing protein n=1 Tax=Fervidicoccus fontis TaxID=683846 RepID=A0A7J3ZIU5_9CREN